MKLRKGSLRQVISDKRLFKQLNPTIKEYYYNYVLMKLKKLKCLNNIFYLDSQICLIGHSQVGKTSITNRYTSDTFSKNCAATVGVEFYLKRIVLQGNRHVTLKVL